MFRAYEPERDRLVAVKVFRLDLPPERVHQLVGEFERLIDVGLRHPAIAAPVATGLDGVVAYLAQNYFSGDSLDIVIRERGPLPLAEALPVARQLAQALDSAAERLVEHGALHPRDVLLSSEGTRIVGLGITRALERIGAAVPIRRPYTAPERVEGAAWDHRADIFSLAAVIHEMLWARRVVGTGLEAVDAMTPLPGTHLTALQAVFSRALAEQAIDRFATATEFVESLERAVGVEEAAPEPLRLRVVEPQRVAPVAELLLPLEDNIALVEPELLEPELPEPELPEPLLPDPVLQLHEPDSVLPTPVEPPESLELLELLDPGTLTPGTPGTIVQAARAGEGPGADAGVSRVDAGVFSLAACESVVARVADWPRLHGRRGDRLRSRVHGWNPRSRECQPGDWRTCGRSSRSGRSGSAPRLHREHGRCPAHGCAEGWKRGAAPARGSASRSLQRPRRRAVGAGWRTRVRRRPRSRVHACRRD